MNKNYKKGVAFLPIIVVIALIIAGIFLFTKSDMPNEEEGRILEVALSQQNNSGQEGTVTITEETDETTKVLVTLSGGKEGVSQPMHIHEGNCEAPGAVYIALNDIVNGTSETILQQYFDSVVSKENSTSTLIINVHKSKEEISNYTACGAIELPIITSGDDVLEGSAVHDVEDPGKESDEIVKDEGVLQEEVQEVAVEYGDAGFSPKRIEITKGTTVTFTNKSARDMWVATDPHPAHTGYPNSSREKCGGSEVSSMFDQCGQGSSFSFTFKELGTWSYHNHLRSGDKGTIVVK